METSTQTNTTENAPTPNENIEQFVVPELEPEDDTPYEKSQYNTETLGATERVIEAPVPDNIPSLEPETNPLPSIAEPVPEKELPIVYPQAESTPEENRAKFEERRNEQRDKAGRSAAAAALKMQGDERSLLRKYR